MELAEDDGTLIRGGLEVTSEQAEIVDHVAENPVTVAAAGAGSGKTRTTVAAVLELLQRGRANLDEFVLITFTNKAAAELRERLETALGEREEHAGTLDQRRFWSGQRERLSAAYLGTIHGFCSWILRTFGYDLGVAHELNPIMSRWRLGQAIEDAVEQHLGDAAALFLNADVRWHKHDLCERVEKILDHLHNRSIRPTEVLRRTEAQAEVATDPGLVYRIGMARLVAAADERYRALKAEEHLLDSADYLSRTAALLDGPTGDAIAKRICRRRRILFIDEFQDTDRTQKRIVDRLLPYLDRLLVVGDQKQSVYGWRAAEVSLLKEIAEEHGEDPLPLNISRRPTSRLLVAQNALFQQISQRFPDLGEPLAPLRTTPEGSDDFPPIVVVQIPALTGGDGLDRRVGAALVVIRELLEKQISVSGGPRPVRAGDIAILARSNAVLARYAAGLAAAGLSVCREAGGAFFQTPEIIDTYRVLDLLVHYPDDTALSVALDTFYFADVDDAAQEQHLLQYRVTEGRPLTDWFEDHYPDRAQLLAALRDAIRTDSVSELLGRLYERFQIRARLAVEGDLGAIANLEKLRDLARELPGPQEQALSVRAFTAWLGQAIRTEREEDEADVGAIDSSAVSSAIRLATIHAAKGREFPFVIVPEIQRRLVTNENAPWFLVTDDGGLDLRLDVASAGEPSFNTMSNRFARVAAANRQALIEEEMRVLYVAVTRAQHGVILIGEKSRWPLNDPQSKYYSWRDEIVRAQNQLSRHRVEYRPS
jgi:DNA helicase-2/ATP-dependent DNA helicase PcrA